MKFSLSWLKDYVSPGISPDSLAHRLTMAGLEVEAVHNLGGDKIFELEVTPNRADCLSLVGMAREVSAIVNKKCDFPKIRSIKFPAKKCDIKILDKKGCGLYIGTIIEDVEITDSPSWIQKRLKSLNTRLICNVVDITNFCLMELGQPLHAFDFDKLEGGKIIVRRAKKGEKIVTIDDIERELDETILVIADAKKPVAIAGVMGGKNTEVSSKTKNILLESAYFDPILIRRASRKLGLTSDSCYRFERGVDFAGVEMGSKRATTLILNHAKGKTVKYSKVNGFKPKADNKNVSVTLEKINGSLGTDLKFSQCRTILNSLEFDVKITGKTTFKLKAPTFRKDITEDVDIVEEIARIIGYDKLPSSMPAVKVNKMTNAQSWDARKLVREELKSQSLSEIVTYSLNNVGILKKLNKSDGAICSVTNPLSVDQGVLRSEMLSSHLNVVHTNINRGQRNLKLFETGKIYNKKGEEEIIAITLCGENNWDWRSMEKKEINFYDAKGCVERLMLSVGIENISFEASDDPNYSSDERLSVKAGQKMIGTIGKVDQDVHERFEIKAAKIYFIQLDGAWIYQNADKDKKFKSITEYPAVTRDISLSVNTSVSYENVKQAVLLHGTQLLQSIDFTEQYLGDKIAKDSHGLVFSLRYQSKERTLREEEVNDAHQKVCKALEEELGATIR